MTVVGILLAALTLESLAPNDVWGGRVRHPAVVNPPVAQPASDHLSLSGEWDFVEREHALGGIHVSGYWSAVYDKYNSYRKIHVPGNWESQGVGKPGRGTCHLGSDNAPKDVKHAFTGEGLYRRKVKIPAQWAGKRIWLKIGGVNCRGYFAIDKRCVAMLTAHAGAWKYDVTDIVKPGGESTIYAMVDNAVGSRNAQPGNVHRWGGLTRDIELEATPTAVWIDDAWVRGDFDTMSAEVKVTLGGDTNLAKIVTQIPKDMKPWSPEHPNLYTARVDLVTLDGKVIQTRYERFGIRKLEVRGKEFYLNNPSWCFASGGNEGKVGPAAGGLIYEYLKRTDPDRLVQEQDGPSSPDDNGRKIEDFCTGPMKVWQRGAFDPPTPFICHEYLNLSVKQDSRLEPKFTGLWEPMETRKKRASRLAAAALTNAWGDRLQDAQHVLQGIFQKDGIERARIDPFCDGYCYWTIADVGVENVELGVYTAQGLFDAFWEPKRAGMTPKDFAVFNSPTCVLGDFCEEPLPKNPDHAFSWGFSAKWTVKPDTNRVFVASEELRVVLKFAHYGEATVTKAGLDWRLQTDDGQMLAGSSEPLNDQTIGGVRELKRLAMTVPPLERPCAANPTFRSAGGLSANRSAPPSNLIRSWGTSRRNHFSRRCISASLRQVPNCRSRVSAKPISSWRARAENRFISTLPQKRSTMAQGELEFRGLTCSPIRRKACRFWIMPSAI